MYGFDRVWYRLRLDRSRGSNLTDRAQAFVFEPAEGAEQFRRGRSQLGAVSDEVLPGEECFLTLEVFVESIEMRW